MHHLSQSSTSTTADTISARRPPSDSYTIHKILPNTVDPLVSLMMVEKVPDSTYEMVGGGLDKRPKESKTSSSSQHPELFESLGIAHQKGVLLSASIIFMDEIDLIGSSRGESGLMVGAMCPAEPLTHLPLGVMAAMLTKVALAVSMSDADPDQSGRPFDADQASSITRPEMPTPSSSGSLSSTMTDDTEGDYRTVVAETQKHARYLVLGLVPCFLDGKRCSLWWDGIV